MQNINRVPSYKRDPCGIDGWEKDTTVPTYNLPATHISNRLNKIGRSVCNATIRKSFLFSALILASRQPSSNLQALFPSTSTSISASVLSYFQRGFYVSIRYPSCVAHDIHPRATCCTCQRNYHFFSCYRLRKTRGNSVRITWILLTFELARAHHRHGCHVSNGIRESNDISFGIYLFALFFIDSTGCNGLERCSLFIRLLKAMDPDTHKLEYLRFQ